MEAKEQEPSKSTTTTIGSPDRRRKSRKQMLYQKYKAMKHQQFDNAAAANKQTDEAPSTPVRSNATTSQEATTPTTHHSPLKRRNCPHPSNSNNSNNSNTPSRRDKLVKKLAARKTFTQQYESATPKREKEGDNENSQETNPNADNLEETNRAETSEETNIAEEPSTQEEETVEEKTSWDTRSILEHPPTPTRDTKSEEEEKEETAAGEVDMEHADLLVEPPNLKEATAFANTDVEKDMQERDSTDAAVFHDPDPTLLQDTSHDSDGLVADADGDVFHDPELGDENDALCMSETHDTNEDDGFPDDELLNDGGWDASVVKFDKPDNRNKTKNDDNDDVDMFAATSWSETTSPGFAKNEMGLFADMEDDEPPGPTMVGDDEPQESKVNVTPYKDDEPLLAHDESRSSEADHPEIENHAKEERLKEKQQRVEAYTAVSSSHSSSDSENEENVDEKDSSSSEEDDVAYVEAESGEEEDGCFAAPNTESIYATEELVDEPPLFHAAAVAAEQAEGSPTKATPGGKDTASEVEITCSPERSESREWIEVQVSDETPSPSRDKSAAKVVEDESAADASAKVVKPSVELENMEFVSDLRYGTINGATSTDSSAVSSQLFGEGFVGSSSDIMSANTSITNGTFGSSSTSRNLLQKYQAPRSASSAEPPPPPPPGEKKRKKKSKKKKKSGSGAIPLIAAPPEEKLKKWEKSKASPFGAAPFGKMETHWEDEAGKAQRSKPEAQTADAINTSAAPMESDVGLAKWPPVVSHASTEEETSVSDVFMNPLDNPFSSRGANTQTPTEPDGMPARAVAPTDEDVDVSDGFGEEGGTADETGNVATQATSSDDIPMIQTQESMQVNVGEGEITYDAAPGSDGALGEHGGATDKDATPSSPSKSTTGSPHIKRRATVESAELSTTSPISGAGPSPKMAEKIARASSAAATKFEERYAVAKASSSIDESEEPHGKKETTAKEEAQPQEGAAFFCSPDTLTENILVTASSIGISDISSQGSKGRVEGQTRDASGNLPSPQAEVTSDEAHDTGVQLVGGAFSSWNDSDFVYRSGSGSRSDHGAVVKAKDEKGAPASPNESISANDKESAVSSEEDRLLSWLEGEVLNIDPEKRNGGNRDAAALKSLLRKDDNLNALCQYVADKADENFGVQRMSERSLLDTDESVASITPGSSALSSMSSDSVLKKVHDSENMKEIKPFQLQDRYETSTKANPGVLAANFVSFLQRVSKRTSVPSPFGEENPFVFEVVNMSMMLASEDSSDVAGAISIDASGETSMQEIIFDHPEGGVVNIVKFFHDACLVKSNSELQHGLMSPSSTLGTEKPESRQSKENQHATQRSDVPATADEEPHSRNLVFPEDGPNPFERTVQDNPSLILIFLGFLGDPQAVCRMKRVNKYCNRIIAENAHVVFRDAVRLGGLSMHLRPAFWLWVTLEDHGRSEADGKDRHTEERRGNEDGLLDLPELEHVGREGKWHHVIQRDVARSFGNMPPHKTGARLRTDSIVRALVTWGQNRIMKRGVKGGGQIQPPPEVSGSGKDKKKSKRRPATGPPPWETGDDASQASDVSQTPTDTVSDWGGISPVGSFVSACTPAGSEVDKASERAKSPTTSDVSTGTGDGTAEELALSGNALTADMKVELQNKLGFILHALAAAHKDVGYCQGMDYVVAHLLRVLQDTVLLHQIRGTLPTAIRSTLPESLVVEETVFRVMDRFLTAYNLRHMYWPELRCLKTCCRVFEKLIQRKLPVLADHFEHHELNIGLFALGWFQTLFLYLPSMPSATVCHMWDIWLVERSFKIFFRVGTAILFLSQPILLNHELEGMMTYLNTFPDATLLNPDILIACALQIKVTNKMLLELEMDVTGGE